MRSYLSTTLMLVALAGLVFVPQLTARADLMLAENFHYPNGDLNGKNGGHQLNGATWDGPWDGPTESVRENQTTPQPIFQVTNEVVVSGNPGTAAENPGHPSSYWSIDRPFTLGLPDNTTTYFSVILNQVGNEGGYEIYLDFDSGIRVGIWNDRWRALLGGVVATESSASIPDAAQDFRAVGRLEFDVAGADTNERLTVWIDPTSEFDTPIHVVETNLGTGITDLGSLLSLTQHSGVDNNKTWDSLLIGTDFQLVNSNYVPEPGTIVLLLSGAVALLLYRRRFRK